MKCGKEGGEKDAEDPGRNEEIMILMMKSALLSPKIQAAQK